MVAGDHQEILPVLVGNDAVVAMLTAAVGTAEIFLGIWHAVVVRVGGGDNSHMADVGVEFAVSPGQAIGAGDVDRDFIYLHMDLILGVFHGNPEQALAPLIGGDEAACGILRERDP